MSFNFVNKTVEGECSKYKIKTILSAKQPQQKPQIIYLQGLFLVVYSYTTYIVCQINNNSTEPKAEMSVFTLRTCLAQSVNWWNINYSAIQLMIFQCSRKTKSVFRGCENPPPYDDRYTYYSIDIWYFIILRCHNTHTTISCKKYYDRKVFWVQIVYSEIDFTKILCFCEGLALCKGRGAEVRKSRSKTSPIVEYRIQIICWNIIMS